MLFSTNLTSFSEHKKHSKEQGLGSTSGQGGATGTVGNAPNTAGPHSKDWANKLDPRYDSNPGSAVTGYAPKSSGTPIADSFTHRDAATNPASTGAIGGAGGPVRDAERHQYQPTNVGDPVAARNNDAVTTRHQTTDQAGSGSHLGRDATIAGGVGGAALGAEKHHHQSDLGRGGASATGQPETVAQTASGAPSSALPTREGNTSTRNIDVASRPGHNDSAQQHYGRDAAVAGGVGAAAYEADKRHDETKDSKQAEKQIKKEQKAEAKEEKREQKQELKDQNIHEKEQKKDHKSGGGLLSKLLHRDKDKKYTKEEEEEFDRQGREHNKLHKDPPHDLGKEATLGAVGGAAIGASAYDAKEHRGPGAETSGQPSNVGTSSKYASEASRDQDGNVLPGVDTDHNGRPFQNTGVGLTGGQGYQTGPSKQTQSGNTATEPSGTHQGTEAALGAGAVGAVGAGAAATSHANQGETETSVTHGPTAGTSSSADKGVVMSESGFGIAHQGHAQFDQHDEAGSGASGEATEKTKTSTDHKSPSESREGRDEGIQDGKTAVRSDTTQNARSGSGLGSGLNKGSQAPDNSATTTAAARPGTGLGQGPEHSKHDSGYGDFGSKTEGGQGKTSLTGAPTTYEQTGHKITPIGSNAATTQHVPTHGPGLSGNTKFSSTGQSLTGEQLDGKPEWEEREFGLTEGRHSGLEGGEVGK